jgi:hypothetical protein
MKIDGKRACLLRSLVSPEYRAAAGEKRGAALSQAANRFYRLDKIFRAFSDETASADTRVTDIIFVFQLDKRIFSFPDIDC